MTALTSVTLTACAVSPEDRPQIAADPVVETRNIITLICPPELLLPDLPAPAVPDNAELRGNKAGLDWLNQILARANLIADRLKDAKDACPNEQ